MIAPTKKPVNIDEKREIMITQVNDLQSRRLVAKTGRSKL